MRNLKELPVYINRIHELMATHADTIKTLAELLGCDRNTMSSYLSGKQLLKVEQLVKIAERYKISACAFFMPKEDYTKFINSVTFLEEKERIIAEKNKLIEQMTITLQSMETVVKSMMKMNEGK